MFIASKNARKKKAHYDTCPYAKRITAENKLHYYYTDEALQDGCVLCQHCSPVIEKYNKRKSDIERLGKRFHLNITAKDGIVYVNDGMSDWQVVYSSKMDKILLFHQNTARNSKDDDTLIKGFHFQKVFRLSVVDVMEYIADHFLSYFDNHNITGGLRNRLSKIAYGSSNRKSKKNKSKEARKAKRRDSRYAVNNVLSLINSLHNNGDDDIG